MTQDDRTQVLAAYADLRVADVRDGMDAVMMHRTGSMSPAIRPLWRTRACGLARTVRYLPYEGNVPAMTPEEYAEWTAWYYKEVCPYPWSRQIEEGDFIVIEATGIDAGLMGSENTLGGTRKGARGYVTSGGVRDTDEIILQEIPFFSRMCSQPMVQARLQFDAMDVPVSVGGAMVNPGDVIVADGDGVIVVPSELAEDVAHYAARELTSDKAGRRKLYEKLGRQPDETVQ